MVSYLSATDEGCQLPSFDEIKVLSKLTVPERWGACGTPANAGDQRSGQVAERANITAFGESGMGRGGQGM